MHKMKIILRHPDFQRLFGWLAITVGMSVDLMRGHFIGHSPVLTLVAALFAAMTFGLILGEGPQR